MLTPVIDLKSKTKDDEDSNANSPSLQPSTLTTFNVGDLDWNVANEYDPMWPNDYEKVAKGLHLPHSLIKLSDLQYSCSGYY